MDCFQELNKRIDELSKSVSVTCTRCSRYGHNSSDCKIMGHYTNNCRTHNNSNSKTDHSQQSRKRTPVVITQL